MLLQVGARRFAADVRQRLYPTLKGFRFKTEMVKTLVSLRRDRKMIEAAGSVMAVGGYFRMPFDMFSLGRSMMEFAMDLFDRPEKVRAASIRLSEDMAPLAVRMAKLVGVSRIFMGLSRSSPSMISPKHMEQFVWPVLSYYVNFAIEHGMKVLLHCDTDWQGAFSMLKRLPPKSCILELDGDTDMFRAKEALGDHMCIMGDIPARLLAFGTKDQVLTYSKKLIEVVGKGGGFILSSGCSVPANAKVENVRALVEAVEEWGWY
jgi:uroporphyrinogen-III decarboxylase